MEPVQVDSLLEACNQWRLVTTLQTVGQPQLSCQALSQARRLAQSRAAPVAHHPYACAACKWHQHPGNHHVRFSRGRRSLLR